MNIMWLIFGLVSIVGVLLIMETDYNDSKTGERYYCEMVEIYKSSDGKYGWPNYRKLNCESKL
jgi:hypothetical protein